jgi:hypothetical protein
LAAEVRDVNDQNHGVRFGHIRHSARQNVVGDLFVLGTRLQAVDTGKINQ